MRCTNSQLHKRRQTYLGRKNVSFIFSFVVFIFAFLLSASCARSVSFFVGADSIDPQSIYVSMEAKWNETPLLQEGLEWAARGGAGGGGLYSVDPASGSARAFFDGFDLMEQLWSHVEDPSLAIWDIPQEEQYKRLLNALTCTSQDSSHSSSRETFSCDLSQSILFAPKRARFEVEMSSRLYSPAVAAHYSLAAQSLSTLPAAKQHFCQDGAPYLLLYASGISEPQHFLEVEELEQHLYTLPHEGSESQGKEAWRRELWLGEDVSGHSFLHLFPSSPLFENANIVIVLFGLPLHRRTREWILRIQTWMKNQPDSKIRFLFGHLPHSRAMTWCPGTADEPHAASDSTFFHTPLLVSGYGATVELKNMEYKTMDKMEHFSSSSLENDSKQRISDTHEAVGGFHFATLHSRYPHLSSSLDRFADHLEREEKQRKSASPGVLLNPRKMERLGYGAVQYLHQIWNDKKSSAAENPNRSPLTSLDRFQEWCHVVRNFPLYAHKVSLFFDASVSVKAGSRHSVEQTALQKELDVLHQKVLAGSSVAYFNRRQVLPSEVSIQGILSLIKESEVQMDRLEEIFSTIPSTESEFHITGIFRTAKVAAPKLHQLVKHTMASVLKAASYGRVSLNSGLGSFNSASFGFLPSRVQVDESMIIWMNDIEKDPQYNELSPSLRSLRQIALGSTDTNLPRRNLFHLVFVLDPLEQVSRPALLTMLSLLEKKAPIRLGLVMADPSWESFPTSSNSTSEGASSKDRRSDYREHALRGMEKMRLMLRKVNGKATDESDSPDPNEAVSGEQGTFLLVMNALLQRQRVGDRAAMQQIVQHVATLINDVHDTAADNGKEEEKIQWRDKEGKVRKWKGLAQRKKYEKQKQGKQEKEGDELDLSLGPKRINFFASHFKSISKLGKREHKGVSDPLLQQKDRDNALADFYVNLREQMSQISFPTSPTILLNGVPVRDESNLLVALQSEAAELWKLVERRIIGDQPPSASESLYHTIVSHHVPVKRLHPALSTSIPMFRWRSAIRSESWVPFLLSFYEQRKFLLGGVSSYLSPNKTPEELFSEASLLAIPQSSPPTFVSGVFVFPCYPTMQSLQLLQKSFTAAEELEGMFRFSWLFASGSPQVNGEDHLIEETLEALLQYPFSFPETLNEPKSMSVKKKKFDGNRKVIFSEALRFSLAHRFTQWVLTEASSEGFHTGSTPLSHADLGKLLRRKMFLSNEMETYDAQLYHFVVKVVLRNQQQKLSLSLHQKALSDQFRSYLHQQAYVESKLSDMLNFTTFTNERSVQKDVNQSNLQLPFIPYSVSSLLLVLHGRAISLDENIEVEDIMEAVRRTLPLSQALQKVVNKINFSDLQAPEGMDLKKDQTTNSENLQQSNALSFLPSRIAMLAAVLTQTEDNIFPFFSEEDSLPRIPLDETQQTSRTMLRVRSVAQSARRHSLTFVLEPTTRQAQIFLSIAEYFLRSPIAVDVQVYLNPGLNMQPIKSFYRFVGEPLLSFEDSGRVLAPSAVFRQLPPNQPLTLEVEAPQSWQVFPHRADADLDHIVLSALPEDARSLFAVYQLQSFIVSGVIFSPTVVQQRFFAERAREFGDQQPPPVTSSLGLPLSLRAYFSDTSSRWVSSNANGTAETVVVSPTGYFQFAVPQPGLWTASIQPGFVGDKFYLSEAEGRRTSVESAWWNHHTDRFSNSSKSSTVDGQRIPVMVDAFYTRTCLFTYDRSWYHFRSLSNIVLQEAEIMYNATVSKKNKLPLHFLSNPEARRPTINIFSIASGHLYERFLRMMMYSVYLATKSKNEETKDHLIKFWLLESFLSPKFKVLVQEMAVEFGFEVGFVHYRWPFWLARQYEKQRKIWAYKVLFLDVLFPFDVDRVIFIDADQFVFQDPHELYELDYSMDKETQNQIPLSEVPTIAMPPFCSNSSKNEATRHYRFWEEPDGFWVHHLQGLPYYNSALFVVDIRRFRAARAGDIFRSTFASLVKDPHSLANLDQDLPNFLQHQVPIYSLPQEWFWCETWCNEESRNRTKTIDLCNHPNTKLPKLESANNIISHWNQYDEELSALFQQLSKKEPKSVPKPLHKVDSPAATIKDETDDDL